MWLCYFVVVISVYNYPHICDEPFIYRDCRFEQLPLAALSAKDNDGIVNMSFDHMPVVSSFNY
ncbi:hypothetical protein MVAC_17333 [Mycolicibacterium vaccae ATCC 25954]|uniref:Uncharacterized protein n=1 Tax=Mycolicibacterium vaccae ATCC 25954 TaxID=1194972 RepID=K0UKX8_MYCVA|nr:hypothetical protein MVAC_17333 [Mycolicibacterium vaccae ATCC 25954]